MRDGSTSNIPPGDRLHGRGVGVQDRDVRLAPDRAFHGLSGGIYAEVAGPDPTPLVARARLAEDRTGEVGDQDVVL